MYNQLIQSKSIKSSMTDSVNIVTFGGILYLAPFVAWTFHQITVYGLTYVKLQKGLNHI